MRRQYNIAKAKSLFSERVQRVMLGEEFITVRGNKPVQKLVPNRAACHRHNPVPAKGVAYAPDLSEPVRTAIADGANTCYLSLATCSEMASKLSLGKLKLSHPIERFIPEQMLAKVSPCCPSTSVILRA